MNSYKNLIGINMKKLFFCVMTLIAINAHAQSVEGNPCIRVAQTIEDMCSAISPEGKGSRYATADGGMEVSMWYHSDKTITGEMKTLVGGKYVTFPLQNDQIRHSVCNYSNLQLQWGGSPGLAGSLAAGAKVVRDICIGHHQGPDLIFMNYI
jgi:hypothetical protein